MVFLPIVLMDLLAYNILLYKIIHNIYEILKNLEASVILNFPSIIALFIFNFFGLSFFVLFYVFKYKFFFICGYLII